AVPVQAGGRSPGVASSKSTVSAPAAQPSSCANSATAMKEFMAFLSLMLRLEGRLDGLRQRCAAAFAPEMDEEHFRLFTRHMMVNGDDVDVVMPQGAQDHGQLVFLNGEVAVHHRAVIIAGEGCPSVHPHILSRGTAAGHLRLASEDHFEHAILA